MADSQTTALSVFSGIGGLDLGWELVTAGRVVGYCERDEHAKVQQWRVVDVRG